MNLSSKMMNAAILAVSQMAMSAITPTSAAAIIALMILTPASESVAVRIILPRTCGVHGPYYQMLATVVSTTRIARDVVIIIKNGLMNPRVLFIIIVLTGIAKLNYEVVVVEHAMDMGMECKLWMLSRVQ